MTFPEPETASLRAELLTVETAVWQALVTGDAVADRALLAPGFLGVYPSGFAGREDHAGQLAGGPTIAEFVLRDACVIEPGPGLGLLAYRAEFRRVGAACRETMFVSSLWRRRWPGWVNLFSQDSPAGTQAPQPVP
ncbi:MAG: DUF4440 domain-containing protein [Pseudorhodobacter sp.]